MVHNVKYKLLYTPNKWQQFGDVVSSETNNRCESMFTIDQTPDIRSITSETYVKIFTTVRNANSNKQ